MQLYIFSKKDLSIIQVSKIIGNIQVNLDEETNNKSQFVIQKKEKISKGDFLYLNGLYKDFYFIVDNAFGGKDENTLQITATDISNIFDRKIIEKNTNDMTTKCIEQFLGETISREFVTTDPVFSTQYIDISIKTQTKISEPTNSENMIYNFHTFLTNCRQNKNIFTNIYIVQDKIRGNRLQIDIEYKELEKVLIDTTVNEVTNYNKIYEVDPIAKVTVFCRDDNSEYNLYLKSDNTTTININDNLRVTGRVEVISVDEAANAPNEALNVIKGNRYKHLVEFDIKKSSKLVDTNKLEIGTPIRIKTEDSIYDSYISAILLTNNEFIKYKSGSLRVDLVDKIKQQQNSQILGNKFDITGGTVKGDIKLQKVTDKIIIIGSTTDDRFLSVGGNGNFNYNVSSFTGWAGGFNFNTNKEQNLGQIGAFGDKDILKYFYFGTYNNPLLKVDGYGNTEAKGWFTGNGITSLSSIVCDGGLNAGRNVQANAYLNLNNKRAIQGTDSWLRLNDSQAFNDGIYCGKGILRTDGTFQCGENGRAIDINSSRIAANVVINANAGINGMFRRSSLFENKSGNNGTITLSDSAANYSFLEIYFRDNFGNCNIANVYIPNRKNYFIIINSCIL